MITLNQNRKIETNLAELVDNYLVLHFDREPILYSGTNSCGNIIIGSSVDENDDIQTQQYLHSIIGINTFNNFLSQKISYLDVLKNAEAIFLINKTYDNTRYEVYPININEIPAKYLPTVGSFCPILEHNCNYDYDLSLHGKTADFHLALPEEINNVQNAAKDIFKVPFKIVNKAFNNLKSNIYISAASPMSAYGQGSFIIKFLIKPIFEGQQSAVVFDEVNFANLLNDYVRFATDTLPEEAQSIVKPDGKETPTLDKVSQGIENFIEKSGYKVNAEYREYIKQALIDSIDKIESITTNIGDGYNSIEIKNNNIPISVIDTKYKNRITDTVKIIEKENPEYHIDTEPTAYEICVYQLNTKTRKGFALIRNLNSEKEMSRPSIDIDGDDPLEETKYTESLYINKWVEVKAIATRYKNRYKTLAIKYEK